MGPQGSLCTLQFRGQGDLAFLPIESGALGTSPKARLMLPWYCAIPKPTPYSSWHHGGSRIFSSPPLPLGHTFL